MATKAPERTVIKSFFLAIGYSNPQQFLHTIVNGMKLLWDESAFPKCVVIFKYYPFIARVCFYCIYKLQNFILKNFENALIEFVQTLPTLRRLWGVKAPFSDFQKNVLVPRNRKQSKKRHDVITLLWQLRCQYNTGHNKFWSLPNTAVVIVSR